MAQTPNNRINWRALWGRAWVRWILGYLLVLACGVGLVYYWRVAYGFSALGPGAATAVVCVAFSAVYWAVFLCAHFVRQKLWLKAACLVVLGGLCFGAANPPLQAPDEMGHYLRAYALGSGHFTFRQDEDFPADVDALCEAFPGFYNRELIEPGLATMAEGFTRYENLKASGAAAPASTLVQQFFGYIPQAAGVAAGDADAKLEVLAGVTGEQVAEMRDYLATHEVSVSPSEQPWIFDIQVRAEAGGHVALCEIAGSHTNVIRGERDDEVLLDAPFEEGADEGDAGTDRSCLSIENIVEFADAVDLGDVKQVLGRQIACNV